MEYFAFIMCVHYSMRGLVLPICVINDDVDDDDDDDDDDSTISKPI